jgi:uncharacterized protein (TIGR00730 family)
MALQRLSVFAGSGPGARPVYAQAARGLGELLARRGIGVVYGGARTGLMGAVADAALAAGGEVIGIIPQHLVGFEHAHTGLTELQIVGTMHERKALMAQRSDAFLALPGGTGTLDELIEMLTWTRLGIHDKPLGLLDVEGFWSGLLAFLEHAAREGFIVPGDLGLVSVDDDAPRLVDTLAQRVAGSAVG